MTRGGIALLVLLVATALAAPWLAPNDPAAGDRDAFLAPPTPIRMVGADGGLRAPFFYPVRLVSRLEQRYDENREAPVVLRWFVDGHLLSAPPRAPGRLLLLGADSFGRDTWSRLVFGARTSLAIAFAATLVSLLIGIIVGGIAGYTGGWIDDVLMRVADFVLVLPAVYVVLLLRAVMPLVLPAPVIFILLAGIFALVGWPVVARGVRAIVAAERRRDYAVAAEALGAGPVRLLTHHLLPACRGYVAVQATLLVPAFILAEATLSFVGLGFPDETPSWGTMLHDAADVGVLGDRPWALAPAAAIFCVILGVNLALHGRGAGLLGITRVSAEPERGGVRVR